MADSPSKRRKLSPTASVPINTSNTPSRIPIPTSNTPSRYPSFASPTKASLARHNPQLLNRPTSSGEPSVRPGSRGRNLQDVFAQALAEKRASSAETQRQEVRETSESVTTTQTTQENDPRTEVLIAQSQQQTQRAITPKRSGFVASGISGQVRRMSRSPAKRSPVKRHETNPFGGSSQPAALDFGADINPFVKKGLRRSPPTGSQQSQEPPAEDPLPNPFKKTGLRRSPVPSSQVTASQATNSFTESDVQREAHIEVQRSEIMRSTVLSQRTDTVERNIQQHAQLELQASGVESSPIARELVESIEENNIQKISGFGNLSDELRRSSDVPSPEESAKGPADREIQNQTRENTEPLTGSPIGSLVSKSIEVETTPLPNITRPTERSQSPLLFGELFRGGNTLQPSPVLQRNPQQTPDTEVQVEEQAGAQLDAELQHSAIVSDPAAIQPSPDVVSESHAPTSEPSSRPAQYATTELSRATARLGRDSNRSPRPVKSPAHTAVDDFFNPFITRRREEPELPPTPTQRGIPDPVVTTPPTGIHDTPSKRERRRKEFGDKQKSSPLKPRDPRPKAVSPDKNSQARAKSLQPPAVAKEPSRWRRSSRFITPVDVHAAKKQKRDDLLRQLQQLQADVSLANQENERIRMLGETKKRPLEAAPNAEEILAMLLRSTAPEPSSVPEPPKPSVMKSMDAFLPFRPRRKEATATVSEKPLPSHLPIVLDDPLPYLQAFSPLNYTSTMTLISTDLPSSETSSQDTRQNLQKYVINATHPSGVFAARLSLVADSDLLAIKTIDVLRLDMSAEAELGTFIRDRATADGPLGQDITVICWAMSRWVEVSIKRARLWCAVESELGDPESQAASLRKNSKKRKRHADGKEDEDSTKWSRKQMLPNMGRTSMVLKGRDVELRFEWKIGFDFTGEVESKLTADARIPVGWQGVDNRHSLAKVPETFGRLVKDKGALGAVRAIVGLMLV